MWITEEGRICGAPAIYWVILPQLAKEGTVVKLYTCAEHMDYLPDFVPNKEEND